MSPPLPPTVTLPDPTPAEIAAMRARLQTDPESIEACIAAAILRGARTPGAVAREAVLKATPVYRALFAMIPAGLVRQSRDGFLDLAEGLAPASFADPAP